MYFLQKLSRPLFSLSLTQFSLLNALWLACALNICFYKRIKELTPYSGFQSYFFIGATILVVVAAYNIVMQIFQWRLSAKPWAFFFIFVGGMSAYSISNLGVVITSDQVQNLMQTDSHEAFDLMSTQFFLWFLGMIFLPAVIISKINIKTERLHKQVFMKSMHILGSLGLIFISLFVFYVDYAAIFREHRDLKAMLSPQNAISASYSYYKKKAPQENLPLIHYGEDAHQTKNVTQSDLPKLMLLVVGETARAESISLNGYQRNTNPELSKQNLINFSQVSSCGTATAVSVPCMFSGMPKAQYDEQLASHREGLLDIAQRAGYKVTWIDNNSGCKGVCNRVEQYPISESLKQKWCKNGKECHDEILIDAFQDYLKHIPKNDHQPRLIVLHQMGSHGPAYYERTTAQYQPFKPTCDTNAIQGCSTQSLVNSYDNSIVYTDHVLSQLIDSLKSVSEFQTGFWYLSDHGESTGEHGLYLHGAPYALAPTQQTHIPMFLWFSSNWQQKQPEQILCLNQQKNHKLSQDHLFPTLLSLLDIQSTVIQPQNNMLALCQSEHHRV